MSLYNGQPTQKYSVPGTAIISQIKKQSKWDQWFIPRLDSRVRVRIQE